MNIKTANSKNRIRVLTTVAVALCAFNGWAMIQANDEIELEENQISEHHKLHSRGPMPVTRMLDKLEVSDQQRAEVREILLETSNRMHALRTDVADQVDAERAEIRIDTRKQLEEVLTDAQLAKYDEMLEKRKHMRHKKYLKQKGEAQQEAQEVL